MKIATLHVDNNIIETRNSMWTGIETVYFNGRKVSSQFNWFVGIHHFEVTADDGYGTDSYRVEFRFDWATYRLMTNVFRNGVCLLDMSRNTYHYQTTPGTALPAVTGDAPAAGEWTTAASKRRVPVYRTEDLV